ncbi:uncharacterized protein EV420DRAFT_1663494 [Desarmillaria tabescens]|uniref:Uncharacterized protein n=1 Tax=Armillaria tabescens TaxID=1929756 RepID=A0AA39NR75_ARMTA|nr:uncharacterized protein EV420DRAFT_1663494 [Desarmillaria tabescens]KAK0470195.1 hypothetical protein EV420DRAFT_1663494 [Desarmillaria tabescens]
MLPITKHINVNHVVCLSMLEFFWALEDGTIGSFGEYLKEVEEIQKVWLGYVVKAQFSAAHSTHQMSLLPQEPPTALTVPPSSWKSPLMSIPTPGSSQSTESCNHSTTQPPTSSLPPMLSAAAKTSCCLTVCDQIWQRMQESNKQKLKAKTILKTSDAIVPGSLVLPASIALKIPPKPVDSPQPAPPLTPTTWPVPAQCTKCGTTIHAHSPSCCHCRQRW